MSATAAMAMWVGRVVKFVSLALSVNMQRRLQSIAHNSLALPRDSGFLGAFRNSWGTRPVAG
jgi:hypothetical protein